MGNQAKVKVRNLTKKFGDLTVLDHVSFDIERGEFVCIVGPTGCGKTTFLNLLVKLLEPTEGNIFIDGEEADPKKHNLSFVFQEPSAFPWLTVEQNIRFGQETKKRPRQEIDQTTEYILEMLGLKDFRNKYPHELSASTEQRIVIGRSFAMKPDLLLMDEPYGQMDLKLRYYLEDEVIRLQQAAKSTVIFITHNIEEAVYLADRCLILSQKPTTVKEEVQINMPHPRNVASKEFIQLREYITEQIRWW
ncbi:MAG: ABC transporter ATP-binding protein [Lachnospiraceae bacterium]|jgi:NitT/TauT family transport system ATP-binding protein|nr:ABC transporter ATP-binding protein [Lachnospiraceae bacterium]